MIALIIEGILYILALIVEIIKMIMDIIANLAGLKDGRAA